MLARKRLPYQQDYSKNNRLLYILKNLRRLICTFSLRVSFWNVTFSLKFNSSTWYGPIWRLAFPYDPYPVEELDLQYENWFHLLSRHNLSWFFAFAVLVVDEQLHVGWLIDVVSTQYGSLRSCTEVFLVLNKH